MADVLQVFSADLDADGGPLVSDGIVLGGSATWALAFAYTPSGGIVLGGSVVESHYAGSLRLFSADLDLAGGAAIEGGIVLGGSLVVGSPLVLYSADGLIPSAGPPPWGQPWSQVWAPEDGLILYGADAEMPFGIIEVSGGIILGGTATAVVIVDRVLCFTLGDVVLPWHLGRVRCIGRAT